MIVPSGILDKVEPPSIKPPSSGGEGGKVCNRRVSPIAARSGERLLSEPTTGTQPCRREPLFMPHCRHSPERGLMHQATL